MAAHWCIGWRSRPAFQPYYQARRACARGNPLAQQAQQALTAGCMLISEKATQRMSATVMMVMLKEQSWPPGANQWYSRPAIAMPPP